MKNSVIGFYLYSHGVLDSLTQGAGSALYASWKEIRFYPHWQFDISIVQSPFDFSIDEIVRPNQYKFVMLDICHGAGGLGGVIGNPPGTVRPGPLDLSWINSFRMNPSGSAGLAWNGDALANYLPLSDGVNYIPSTWYTWRNKLWDYLESSPIQDSVFQATLHTPLAGIREPIYPWDQGRIYLQGDGYTGLP